MKKTEKIEIRISPEDKEALARRAEAEGRAVSEVVRDLLDANGVTMATRAEGPSRSRPPLIALPLLAVGLLCAGLGAAATHALTRPTTEHFVVARAAINAGEFGRHVVNATVPEDALDGLTMVVPTAGGTYRIELDAKSRGEDSHRVAMTVCLAEGEACAPLAASFVDTSLRRSARLVGWWSEEGGATVELFALPGIG